MCDQHWLFNGLQVSCLLFLRMSSFYLMDCKFPILLFKMGSYYLADCKFPVSFFSSYIYLIYICLIHITMYDVGVCILYTSMSVVYIKGCLYLISSAIARMQTWTSVSLYPAHTGTRHIKSNAVAEIDTSSWLWSCGYFSQWLWIEKSPITSVLTFQIIDGFILSY